MSTSTKLPGPPSLHIPLPLSAIRSACPHPALLPTIPAPPDEPIHFFRTRTICPRIVPRATLIWSSVQEGNGRR
eukprot:11272472-Prorocentrum_lima.AAC.1